MYVKPQKSVFHWFSCCHSKERKSVVSVSVRRGKPIRNVVSVTTSSHSTQAGYRNGGQSIILQWRILFIDYVLRAGCLLIHNWRPNVMQYNNSIFSVTSFLFISFLENSRKLNYFRDSYPQSTVWPVKTFCHLYKKQLFRQEINTVQNKK